eukprot:3659898-Pyramimonas_sp.AAC.1
MNLGDSQVIQDIKIQDQPIKIPKVVEYGNDDCGDDFKGLGCSAHCTDAPLDSDAESDGEEETFITAFAGLPAGTCADVFSIIPTLCYGRHNK